MPRKPWEILPSYNEDRFDDDGPSRSPLNEPFEPADESDDGRDAFDDEDDGGPVFDDGNFTSLNDEPLDYGNGPHEEDYDLEDDGDEEIESEG